MTFADYLAEHPDPTVKTAREWLRERAGGPRTLREALDDLDAAGAPGVASLAIREAWGEFAITKWGGEMSEKFGSNPWDWADLAKRLLALGQLGCHIRGADGHFWIESGEADRESAHLAWTLKKAGILLNAKIYGGVLEALDTIDAAMAAAGQMQGLRAMGEDYIEGQLDLGSHGVDASRIDRVDPGHGGIS